MIPVALVRGKINIGVTLYSCSSPLKKLLTSKYSSSNKPKTETVWKKCVKNSLFDEYDSHHLLESDFPNGQSPK